MKKRILSKWLLTGILIFMFSCIWTVQAQAGTYRPVTTKKATVGAYKVWLGKTEGLYYEKVSTGKRIHYRGNFSAVTDGKYLYYAGSDYELDRLYIYRHKMGADMTDTDLICEIKHGSSIVGVYGKEIFVTVHNSTGFYGHDYTYLHTAAYNRSTKKSRIVMRGIASSDSYGRYIFGCPNTGATGVETPLKVYNAATKRTTLLTKDAEFFQRIGSYIYYAHNVKELTNDTRQMKVYRYKLGSTKRTLVSKKTFTGVYVLSMTSSSIRYMNSKGKIVTSKY